MYRGVGKKERGLGHVTQAWSKRGAFQPRASRYLQEVLIQTNKMLRNLTAESHQDNTYQ